MLGLSLLEKHKEFQKYQSDPACLGRLLLTLLG